MNIIERALEIKGQFCTVNYSRECKVLKNAPSITKVTKASSMRIGCQYDAMKVVQEAKGVNSTEEAHELNQGLRGMHWKIYPVLLASDRNDTEYVRFETCENTKFESKYYMEGKEVKKEEIEQYLQANEKKSSGCLPPVMNIKVESISSLS